MFNYSSDKADSTVTFPKIPNRQSIPLGASKARPKRKLNEAFSDHEEDTDDIVEEETTQKISDEEENDLKFAGPQDKLKSLVWKYFGFAIEAGKVKDWKKVTSSVSSSMTILLSDSSCSLNAALSFLLGRAFEAPRGLDCLLAIFGNVTVYRVSFVRTIIQCIFHFCKSLINC